MASGDNPCVWSEALSFVLGAGVVATIALGRELIVERRREAQAIRTEQRRWEREDTALARITRSARRLVADELDTLANHLAMMLRKDQWPAPEFVDRASFLPQTEWEANKAKLAEGLEDDNTWDVLSAFHYSAGQLRARALSEQPGARVTDKERESLVLMQDQARVLHAVVLNDVPLPDDWRAQLAAVRDAGKDAEGVDPDE